MKRTRLPILLALSAFVPLSPTSAQLFDVGAPTELDPGPGLPDQARFGSRVAIDGDTFVVGAPGQNSLPGQVYVYDRDGLRRQVISAPGGVAAGRFGASIAVQPGRLIIGAPGEEAAYLYSRIGPTYELVERLAPAEPGGNFGTSVALFGFSAWVGSTSTDIGGVTNNGAVHWFTSDILGNWREETRIDGPPVSFALFGYGLAYSSGRLFVGAPNAGLPGRPFNGLIYVYSGSDGTHLQTIRPTDSTANGTASSSGGFGARVVAEGDRIAVTAQADTDEMTFYGSVHIYDFDGTTWEETHRLRRPGPTSFGAGLSMSGSTILVRDNITRFGEGSIIAYRYDGVEWRESGEITSPDYSFGTTAINGLDVVVGASGDSVFRYTFTIVPDTDDDGIRDSDDDDDDNDGVLDAGDTDPLDPMVCRDADSDRCDDCSMGTDGFGPMPDFDTAMDGPDDDADGVCNTADLCIGDDALGDPDRDGVCGEAGVDAGPLVDAGPSADGGLADAGPSGSDAGPSGSDGGAADSGSTPPEDSSGCAAGGGSSPSWFVALALLLFQRRRQR